MKFSELPPRARRILTPRGDSIQLTGTTSACAENTLTDHRGVTHVGNYLRVRGEYPISRTKYDSSSELPPRARRILSPFLSESPHEGTTSACAENTRLSTALTTPRWNYLRVRGEYLVSPPLVGNHDELPPRARRIRERVCAAESWIGTTSACAENTFFAPIDAKKTRNYLRVRGEYAGDAVDVADCVELPPRARRIRAEKPGPSRH